MAEEDGQVINCPNADALNEWLQKGYQCNKLVVVAFMDSWSGASRFMTPLLTHLATKMQNVLFLMVDVDELEPVALEWNVEAKPTFKFMKDQANVATIVGANKHLLLQTILQQIMPAN